MLSSLKERSSNGCERSEALKNTRAIASNAQWPQRTLEQWLRAVASKNTRAIASNAQWPHRTLEQWFRAFSGVKEHSSNSSNAQWHQRTLEQWLRACNGLKEHSSNSFECSMASKGTRAMFSSAQWPRGTLEQ